MIEGTAPWLRGVGFVAGGALFWLMYFDLKDRLRPEPRRLLSVAFLLGGAAALIGLWVYRLGAWFGIPDFPGPDKLSILFYCTLWVGPLEEGLKFLVARAVVFRFSDFDEPIDGLVYASAVAIGFASVENLLYLPFLDWPEQLARALASPLTHSLFAALWGLGTSHALTRARGRWARFAWQAFPLLLAMLLHGLYDYFLLAMNATFVASGVALVLWLFLIVQARRLVERQADEQLR